MTVVETARELTPLAVAWLCAGLCASAMLRARSGARRERQALETAGRREALARGVARRITGAAARSTADVREEIAAGVRVVVPAVDGVLLFEEWDGALRCTLAAGNRFVHYAGSQIALDDTSALPARALRAGHHVTLGPEPIGKPHPSDVAAVAVPLVLDHGRAAALVACAAVPLDAPSLARIVALADQAAPAYLIALEREDDRRRAEFDGLTGLLTPRAFRQRLIALVDRARVVPTTRLGLLFVDTDRFKHWNDAYGHAAGDALLRELARLLRTAVGGDADLVARNGGDEFCIVFAGIDKATAIERAERLRARIAALDFAALRPAGTNATVGITASIGVAAFPADASSANDLLELADAAMYHAKESGRDGVAYGVPGGLCRLSTEERD